MNYRNHPIVEGLKVNEDGTSIMFQGKELSPKEYSRPNNSIPMLVVSVNRKTVTVMRLVSECWIGMPESLELVVKKIDPTKGNHYTNLCWSRQGYGLSHNSPSIYSKPKFSEAQYRELLAKKKSNESIKSLLKRENVSNKAYYTAKNRYE